jgi:hypothetical protein
MTVVITAAAGEIVKVAKPPLPTVAVPRVTPLALKVTVPAFANCVPAFTVAVNVTVWP